MENITENMERNRINIKNWKKYIGSDAVYLFLLFFITVDKMFGTTMMGSRYPEDLKVLLRLLLVLFVVYKSWCRREYARYEWALSASIMILSVFVWYNTGYIEIIEVALLVLGARGVKFNNILKTYLLATVPILIGTVVLARLWYIENLFYFRGDRVRIAFGFIFPTDFAAHVFFVVMAWCVLRKGILRYYEVGGIMILIWFLNRYCDVRLNVICLSLSLVSFFAYKKWNAIKDCQKKEKIAEHISTLIIIGIIGCIFIMIILSYLYDPENAFLKTVDHLLSERLQYGKRGFAEFGIPLFGQRLPVKGMGGTVEWIPDYFFLDSSYVRFLLEYGLVLFTAVFAMIMINVSRLKKNRQYYLLIAWMMICIQCAIEHHFLEIAYNPFVYMIFADYASGQKQNDISMER